MFESNVKLISFMKISKTLFLKKKINMPCSLTANIRYFYKTFH